MRREHVVKAPLAGILADLGAPKGHAEVSRAETGRKARTQVELGCDLHLPTR